jgi:DNA-binding NtrC family response regulator
MIGQSEAFRETVQLVTKIATCDAPVVIEGETGTGKELVARTIHYQGNRHAHPFVPVNCGAIPDLLIENELFGHRKGAYTDAREDRPGLIAHARSGTLLLDEIDALSPRGQVALLRFLQDQRYRPVGGRQEQEGDVRIIAASNRDLTQLVEAGVFREDLFYRLKILFIEIPPLRERKGDPELLAKHFVELGSKRFGKHSVEFHPDTLEWFGRYCWPGNVRELENLVYRALLLADSPIVDIPPLIQSRIDRRKRVERRSCTYDGLTYVQAKAKAMEHFETTYLRKLMTECNGNVTRAAQRAGTERRYLGRLLKKFRIEKQQGRISASPGLES